MMGSTTYGRRIRSQYVGFLGALAVVGQPIAGLLYDSKTVFLGLYGLRESWLVVGVTSLFVSVALSIRGRVQTIRGFFPVAVYVVVIAFVMLVLLSERTPSGMIVFLQFRNLFGFVLVAILLANWEGKLDPAIMSRSVAIVGIVVVTYTLSELGLLMTSGELLSDEYFNKKLLEEAKGTRADVGGGIIAGLRIPGPLFNPSQLGVFCVYLIYAGTQDRRVFRVPFIVALSIVVLLGFSKSAFVMMFMLIVLRMLGRQFALIVLLAFLFSPLILGVFESVLSSYHYASISRHFEGYTSALALLTESPVGSGVGSAGELATTLGGFEADAGFESGLGTIITNLGVFGVLLYASLGAYCYLAVRPLYFDLYALWSVSMFFNESALSPHLFVFQACAAAALSLPSAHPESAVARTRDFAAGKGPHCSQPGPA